MVAISAIPVFKLYGEGQDWPTPDLLHCETIPKRSREHHWEIRPHRHADLCQLLYLHEGQARIEVEGQRKVLNESMIQVVPPLCVHGFQFSENVDGYVITLAAPLVSRLHERLVGSLDRLDRAAHYLAGADRDWLNSQFAALHDEYQNERPGREVMLQSLISMILVWVARQARERSAAQQMDRGREAFERFSGLVEAHYTEHRSIEWLAHRIGVSVAHLNNLCRELAGQTALQILHQRLLLEAKRQLIYTTMSINQVADGLGFADSAYFARFFRRLAGLSPRAFRALGTEALQG